MNVEETSTTMLGPVDHIGIVVPRLVEGIAALGPLASEFIAIPTPAEGLPVKTSYGLSMVHLRAAYAGDRIPFLEVIEAVPGSVWPDRGHAYVHHLGYWIEADEMEAVSAGLIAAGLPRVAMRSDGTERVNHFAYHALGDLLIEIVDARRRFDLIAPRSPR